MIVWPHFWQVTAQWIPPEGGAELANGDDDDLSTLEPIPYEPDEELMEMSGNKPMVPELFQGFSFVRGSVRDAE